MLAPARKENAIRPSPCIWAHIEQPFIHQAGHDLRHCTFITLDPASNRELTHCIFLLADEALGRLKHAPLREGQPMPPQSTKRQAPKQRCSRPSTKNLVQPSIRLGRLPFLVANRTNPDLVIRERSPSACHPPPAARDMPKVPVLTSHQSCREFRLVAAQFPRKNAWPPSSRPLSATSKVPFTTRQLGLPRPVKTLGWARPAHQPDSSRVESARQVKTLDRHAKPNPRIGKAPAPPRMVGGRLCGPGWPRAGLREPGWPRPGLAAGALNAALDDHFLGDLAALFQELFGFLLEERVGLFHHEAAE